MGRFGRTVLTMIGLGRGSSKEFPNFERFGSHISAELSDIIVTKFTFALIVTNITSLKQVIKQIGTLLLIEVLTLCSYE